MLNRVFAILVLAGVLAFPWCAASASGEERLQQQTQTQEQERIYGSQLMTRQERAEYRARMRAAKTAEEREQIRKEHHERMKERAKEHGKTLPDEPPAKGMRMEPMGGGGMGQGRRR